MLEKPIKLYRSIAGAKKIFGCYARKYKSNEYPCLHCHHHGRDNMDQDVQCVGGVPMFICRFCNGTGLGPKEEFMKEYTIALVQHQEDMDRYKAYLKQLKTLKKEMLEYDFELIATHGDTLLPRPTFWGERTRQYVNLAEHLYFDVMHLGG